jgi:hypothetical protein
MNTIIRVASRRALTTGLLVITLAAAAAGVASAQSQPSPAPSAAPTDGGVPNTGVPKPPVVPAGTGRLPIIDIVPVFTQPETYGRASQIKNYDPIDVGGTVRIPLSTMLSVSFDRNVEGTLNQPVQTFIAANGTVTAPAATRDVILVYRADAQLKQLTVEGGFSFRHREFATGASGVSGAPFPFTVSSTEHHFGYVGLTYATKPISGFLNSWFALNVTGYGQNVDHHVGALCSAALVKSGACGTAGSVYYINEGAGQDRYYESSESLAWLIPFKPGVVVTLKETIGALNFYENAVGPYRWDSYDVEMITKKFNPTFSLSLRHQHLHQALQGYPFPFPQALDVGSIDILADFHLDFNHLGH